MLLKKYGISQLCPGRTSSIRIGGLSQYDWYQHKSGSAFSDNLISVIPQYADRFKCHFVYDQVLNSLQAMSIMYKVPRSYEDGGVD
jgi:hypothetical protein